MTRLASTAPSDQAIEMLTHAVMALAERVQAQTGLQIELDMRLAYEQGRTAQRHTPDVETALYRLVQEALTNAVKHARAERVSITIADTEDDEGNILIEVTDDGEGFDADGVTGGFGLVGMRERVSLVRGELEVTSRPGDGTTIRARIPVRRQPLHEPKAADAPA